MLTLGSAGLQLLIGAQIVLIATKYWADTPDPSAWDVTWLVIVTIIAGIALAVVQSGTAKLLAHAGKAQRPLTIACASMGCLMVLFAFIPPVASHLAGAVLSAPASGGLYHVQAQWAADAPKERRAIRCMHILAAEGDHYIVRATSKPSVIHFLPRKDIAAWSRCGSDGTGVAPEADSSAAAAVESP